MAFRLGNSWGGRLRRVGFGEPERLVVRYPKSERLLGDPVRAHKYPETPSQSSFSDVTMSRP